MSDDQSSALPACAFYIPDPFRPDPGLPAGHTSALRLVEYARQLLNVASAAGYGSVDNCVTYTVGDVMFTCHNNTG